MYKPDFADKYPESHKMLMDFFRVPPRRTLIDVSGDWSVVILYQPDDEALPMERHELPYELEKIAWALEFFLSLAQEAIFNTRSWDYSTYWLNIDGRTTVPYALVWGVLVLILAKWVCPFIDGVYRQLSEKQANKLCLAIMLFLIFDITLSIAAVYRQEQRDKGVPAENGVEEFLDENFDDEKLDELFPSTKEITD